MSMQKRSVFTALLFLPFFISCKKSIQDTKQNIVMAAITNGRWYVSEYKVGSTDVTAEFAGYEFQFYGNGTVDGIKETSTTSGTWSGDANTFTITSNFSSSAGLPLTRLNGVWKWTDSDWSYVKTFYVNGAETYYLTLRKK
jgi:hypothetical protein